MAGNPFDAFDQAPAAPAGGNPFDAFDAPAKAVQQEERPGFLERLGKGLLGSAANSTFLGNLAQLGARGGMAAPDQTPPGGDAIVHPDLRAFDKDIAVPPPQGIGEHLTDLLSGVLGGTASPEGMVGPTFAKEGAGVVANTLRSAAGQGVVMGALNPVTQGARMLSGAQDKFEPEQIPESIATGALGGGALHLGAEAVNAAPAIAQRVRAWMAARNAPTPTPGAPMGPAEPHDVLPEFTDPATARDFLSSAFNVDHRGLDDAQVVAAANAQRERFGESIQEGERAKALEANLQPQALQSRLAGPDYAGGFNLQQVAGDLETQQTAKVRSAVRQLIDSGVVEPDPERPGTLRLKMSQPAYPTPEAMGQAESAFRSAELQRKLDAQGAPRPDEAIQAIPAQRDITAEANAQTRAQQTFDLYHHMEEMARDQRTERQVRGMEAPPAAPQDGTGRSLVPVGDTLDAARQRGDAIVDRAHAQAELEIAQAERLASNRERMGGDVGEHDPVVYSAPQEGASPAVAGAHEQAGGAFAHADAQRQRVQGFREETGVNPADSQPGGRPEGRGAQDVIVHGPSGQPVRIVDTSSDGRQHAVEPYDPRTGEATGDQFVAQAKELSSVSYSTKPRMAQDFEARAQSPRVGKGEARGQRFDDLSGMPRQTYRETAPNGEGAPGERTSTRTQGPAQVENIEPHQELGGIPERTPERTPELENVRSIADQSGARLDPATEQRAAEHVADGAEPHEAVQRAVHEDAARVDIEAAEHAAGTHAPEPAERIGSGAEPGPERDGGPDGPAREQPQPADRAEAASAPGEPQLAGHAEEPAPEQPEPPPSGAERGTRPGEPEDYGSPEWQKWHRQYAKQSEPDGRTDHAAWMKWFNDKADTERAAYKDWNDRYDAEQAVRDAERKRRDAEREAKYQREKAERDAEAKKRREEREAEWENIWEGMRNRRRGRQENQRRERGRPSDSRTGDPFLDAEGTPEAKAGRDDRFDVGKGGVVKSDKGGPITFGDQKQAARWILKANKTSPDQIFEVANHPAKGGSYTVRETGRSKPTGAGTTLYSNPVGPAFKAAADFGRWLSRGHGDVGVTTADVKALKGRLSGGRPVAAVKLFTQRIFRSDAAYMRSVANDAKSKVMQSVIDKLDAVAGRGDAPSKTFDEAVEQAKNPRLKKWAELSAKARELGLSGADVKAMVNRTKAATGEAYKVAEGIRALLKDTHSYVTDAGVDLGERRNYFPREYDQDAVKANRDEFIKLAAKEYGATGSDGATAKRQAEALADTLIFGDALAPGTPNRAANATATKERQFNASADKTLAKFFMTDLDTLGPRYLSQMARRAEIARRFGDKFQGDKKLGVDGWQQIADKMRLEGAGDHVESLRQFVQNATGTLNVGSASSRAGSALRTWTSLVFMDHTMLWSLTEPMLMGMRTGRVTDGLTAFHKTVASTYRLLKDKPDELRELAEDLGISAGLHQGTMMANRYNGGDAVSRFEQKTQSGFFHNNLLDPWTQGERIASVNTGRVYLRRLALDMEKGGDKAKAARYMLGELGVKDADGFAKWHAGFGGDMPERDGVMSGHKQADAYRTALLRFSDQTVFRPGMKDRPRWASTPGGAVRFQLQAYGMAFGRQVMGREANIMRAGIKGELPASVAAAHFAAAFLPGMMALYAGQYLLGEGEDKVANLFNHSQSAADRMTPDAKAERAISRSGATGGADPYIQLVAPTKYNASFTQKTAGAALGGVGQAIDSILGDVWSHSKGNGPDRAFHTALYDYLIRPAMMVGLASSATAGSKLAILGTIFGADMLKPLYVDAMAGRADPNRQQKITGIIDRVREKFGLPDTGTPAARSHGAFR